MKIYLVRHGKIEWNKSKAYIGQLDLPLSAEGIIQCDNLQAFFKEMPLDKIYSSSLKRCLHTTEILLGDRKKTVVVEEGFKEINMGVWEGVPFHIIKELYPDEYEKRGQKIETYKPIGGESFDQLKQRVLPILHNIIRESNVNPGLIVTHAGVIRVILGEILGLSINEMFKWSVPFAGIIELDRIKANKWVCNMSGCLCK